MRSYGNAASSLLFPSYGYRSGKNQFVHAVRSVNISIRLVNLRKPLYKPCETIAFSRKPSLSKLKNQFFIFHIISNGLRENTMEINGFCNGLRKNTCASHIPCVLHLTISLRGSRIAPPMWYSRGSSRVAPLAWLLQCGSSRMASPAWLPHDPCNASISSTSLLERGNGRVCCQVRCLRPSSRQAMAATWRRRQSKVNSTTVVAKNCLPVKVYLDILR